jgi:hypothetical protein
MFMPTETDRFSSAEIRPKIRESNQARNRISPASGAPVLWAGIVVTRSRAAIVGAVGPYLWSPFGDVVRA